MADPPAHNPDPLRHDAFNPEVRSAIMRAVKSRDTTPERTVRRMVRALGAGYRLHRKDLPGAPDLAFIGRRRVIFVHGCFWHGHDCARGARVPKTNRAYWTAKIARNRARDAAHRAAYADLGWDVLTVWECETRGPGLARLAQRLAAFLGLDRRPTLQATRERSAVSRKGTDRGRAI